MEAFREMIAIVIWMFSLCKLFIFDVDVALWTIASPRTVWMLNYRWLGVLLVISALWWRLGKRFWPFCAYVAFYPAVLLCWKLPSKLVTRWESLVYLLPAAYDLLSELRMVLTFYSLAILAAVVVAESESAWALWAFGSLMLIVILFNIVRSFLRAYRSNVFADVAALIRRWRERLVSNKGTDEGSARDLPQGSQRDQMGNSGAGPLTGNQREAEVLSEMAAFYVIGSFILASCERASVISKSRRVDLYLVSTWLFLCVETVLGYAVVYLAVYKIDHLSFSCPRPPDFWSFVGYSFGKIAPSSVSSIVPVRTLAQVVSYFEIASAVGLFVVMIFVILTASRERYRESVEEFSGELAVSLAEFERVIVAKFRLSLVELEVVLIERNNAVVSFVRKMRGHASVENGDSRSVGNALPRGSASTDTAATTALNEALSPDASLTSPSAETGREPLAKDSSLERGQPGRKRKKQKARK